MKASPAAFIFWETLVLSYLRGKDGTGQSSRLSASSLGSPPRLYETLLCGELTGNQVSRALLPVCKPVEHTFRPGKPAVLS